MSEIFKFIYLHYLTDSLSCRDFKILDVAKADSIILRYSNKEEDYGNNHKDISSK